MECEEQLIEKVKENDFFYDRRSGNFKNVILKAKKWKEIADELNIPVEKAKKRWKTIKDRYHRTNKDKKPYKFSSQLSFLDNCKKVNKKTTIKYSETGCEDLGEVGNDFFHFLPDSEGVFCSETTSTEGRNTPPKKKELIRKPNKEFRKEIQQVINKSQGKTKEEMFCESLAIQLIEAQLPSDRFRALQIKCLQILDEEVKEMKMMNE